ncbi:MAG: UDP-N-acetylglucosamine 1-carboxyvinyltransferase [Candidatus Erginobacter occultus]|nr:UDP-N-acetylglucosamine 1-carboxyvinyltransferase [Candidatus Erginobacter occultus]
MDNIEIIGGNPLRGEVEVSGAKNAALPIMAAALLAPGKSVINRVPRLRDIETMLQIFRHLGVRCGWTGPHTLEIDAADLSDCAAPYELVRKMRASVLVLGPLLGRLGKARVSIPGGCVIGPRPIDLHLKGLEGLSAQVEIEHGYINARAGNLKGGEIYLGGRFGSSVGATCNCLLAASVAAGTTTIVGAACEPEVIDLAGFLNQMGGRIAGAGSPRITVEGVKELRPAEYNVIPDRIEAGTYLIAAAITGGEIVLHGGRADHLDALLERLQAMGAVIGREGEKISLRREGGLSPVEITTLPYPGFPTDLQAQMMALLSTVPGISVIIEKVYPERFMHIAELNRLGAEISLEGPAAIVRGGRKLSGAEVMASDLRASAALILAGLVAEGRTTVRRVYHLDRGYENMVEKLTALGAAIRRLEEQDI